METSPPRVSTSPPPEQDLSPEFDTPEAPPRLVRETVAEHLLHHIGDAGVRHIFGVPGDFSLSLLDVIEADPRLTWVGCATELGAAYCADGYARALGAGVVMTTYGVGELSAATAMAGATAEDVPVLHVVTGPPMRAFEAGLPVHHTFADGDMLRFCRAAAEIHGAVHQLTDTEPLRTLAEAVRSWRQERRTTYLLIPQDAVSMTVEGPWEPVGKAAEAVSTEAQELLREFHAAHPEAPLVWGNIAQRRGLRPLVEAFSATGTPMAVLPNAKGLVDESDPSYIGVYNGQASRPEAKALVENAPGRVLIGCTLADTTTGGFSHVFPPESTLALGADSVTWGTRTAPAPLAAAATSWLSLARGSSQQTSPTRRDSTALPERVGSLTQNAVWNAIARQLPAGCRIFAEVGSPSFAAQDITFPDDTVLESASIWNAIGYSLPACIGAALADRERRVLAVIGDGAAQMTANEFGLLSRFAARPIIVLIDNDGYTVERVIRGETAAYNDIAPWRWSDVPAALGAGADVRTTLCDSSDAFSHALGAAFEDAERAHVIVVELERYDGTPSLHLMGQFMRSQSGLPPLPLHAPPRQQR